MVFTNFAKNTPKKIIMQELEKWMGQAGVGATENFTLGPFGKTGIVRFENEEQKGKFKRWLQGKKLTTEHAAEDKAGIKQVFAGNNVGKVERGGKMVVGKVKQAMMMELGDEAGEVTVDYSRYKVYQGRELVARWKAGGPELVGGDPLYLKGKAEECKGRIAELIMEAKRKQAREEEEW